MAVPRILLFTASSADVDLGRKGISQHSEITITPHTHRHTHIYLRHTQTSLLAHIMHSTNPICSHFIIFKYIGRVLGMQVVAMPNSAECKFLLVLTGVFIPFSL